MPRTVHNEGTGGFAGCADRNRAPDQSVRLPGRRRPALAGRARARRGSSLPAGPGAGAAPGAPGTPWPMRATRCVTSPQSSAGGWACRSSGATGDLRPSRPDLRDRPALVQYPYPEGARLGADPPEPSAGPPEHSALTGGDELLAGEGGQGWSADRALTRRDGGKHRPDHGEVNYGGTAVPDISFRGLGVRAGAARGGGDRGAQHNKEIYLFCGWQGRSGRRRRR